MEGSDESDYGEDMLQMVEDDDLEFLKNAINKRSYDFLKHVTRNEGKSKRRKVTRDESEALENEYEDQLDEPVTVKTLLPIKTKKGIVTRTIETAQIDETDIDKNEDHQTEEDESGDEYVLESTAIDPTKPKSTADLLATYNESLRTKKVHIGYLCANLLENPEENVTNFRTLLRILDEDATEAYLSVRKLIVVSVSEVFKDILPSYQIKYTESSGVKLKKDTYKLKKYEEALLQYYKKYLQKLEKFCSTLIKKRGDTRQRSQGEIMIGELALQAMCDLLVSHPYFNYSQNIAQAIVPFLNHSRPSVRQLVSSACKTVFKEDRKEEITLKILRLINQHVKNRAHNVHPDVIEVLLHLRIKEVNLDQEKQHEIKQKKQMSHKQNILKLSKKERKRKKRLEDLEKEMLETKAEENKQSKQKNLTEITKIVFGLYFRILKSSTNTKVLGVCLEGLAKYSHCINLDYYVDLLNLLNGLLQEDWLGYREQLHCIQTVFAILSDQGEGINLDPTRFYTNLYKNLLTVHASKNYVDFPVVLKTLVEVLVRRRKKITSKRLIGFIKRVSTLSLQLVHNGTLSCLGIIKTVLQLNKAVDVLLDLDTSVGDGDYRPEIEDAEYCNAASTALFELALLIRHYHPIVGKYARHIANGVPASGEGSLPPQYGKCSPEQLFRDHDMSEMAFNPTIPVPKKIQPKLKFKRLQFADDDFRVYCKGVLKNSSNCSTFL